VVLEKMYELGYISRRELVEEKGRPVSVLPYQEEEALSHEAPYFVEYV
jgi:membrane carboxypeptidase/penicillin-binding protein